MVTKMNPSTSVQLLVGAVLILSACCRGENELTNAEGKLGYNYLVFNLTLLIKYLYYHGCRY